MKNCDTSHYVIFLVSLFVDIFSSEPCLLKILPWQYLNLYLLQYQQEHKQITYFISHCLNSNLRPSKIQIVIFISICCHFTFYCLLYIYMHFSQNIKCCFLMYVSIIRLYFLYSPSIPVNLTAVTNYMLLSSVFMFLPFISFPWNFLVFLL